MGHCCSELKPTSGRITRPVRNAQRIPVFKADRIHQRQLLHLIGIEQRVACGQHASGGVAEKRFAIEDYTSEALLPEDSPLVGKTVLVQGGAGASV